MTVDEWTGEHREIPFQSSSILILGHCDTETERECVFKTIKSELPFLFFVLGRERERRKERDKECVCVWRKGEI